MTDVFDSLLISSCDVYRKGAGSADAYGVEDQTLTLVQAGVACRFSQLGGREFKKDKSFSIGKNKVFLRPNANVNEHSWLKFNGDYYNVLTVSNPSGMDHHYEVEVELVKP